MPEAAVWDHVAELLADPARPVAQFARLAAAEDGSDRERAADQLLRTRMERNSRADKRLLDADEAGVISLAEMSERRHRLAEERRALDRQQQERERLRQQRAQAEAARSSLEAFCSRIGARLENTSFADKQAILQLVIERIIVGDGSLEIRLVVPLSPAAPSGSGNPPRSRNCVRMAWTRQACQVACSTLVTAALRPSWASEMTSLTPRRPRRTGLRRKSSQKVSASEAPMAMPSTSRRPSLLTPTAMVTATGTMRPASRTFT